MSLVRSALGLFTAALELKVFTAAQAAQKFQGAVNMALLKFTAAQAVYSDGT